MDVDEEGGLSEGYDLKKGGHVQVTGPFGATFLMPDEAAIRNPERHQ